ncbi:hypothetical protein V1264_022443 [Littorina saxatilis]|uniref:Uncharacterized protein n=1 Tax=Littorina saxatilis TaxID=31220 RepID=A0AAN9FXE7_9CAEN
MMCADGWLKTVDLDSMTVKHVLRGYMRDWVDKSTVLINNRADVLTLTKHRHHLQIFNFSLGKVTKTIQQKGETLHKLNHVVANKGSTVAVSGTDDHRSLLVFDLQQTTHLYSLQASELHQPDLQFDEQITLAPNGRFMVLGGRICPRGSVPGTTEGIKHEGMLVYDLQQRQLVRYLQDNIARKLGWKYWVVRTLDDDRVLSCCLDTCARVHNIHTGEVLWRMEGKLSSPYPYLEPDCPLLVMKVMHRANTFSVYTLPQLSLLASFSMDHKVRINTFSVYTLPQLSLLASFSMDHKLGDFQLLPGVEEHFLAVHPKYPLPVVFTMHDPSRLNQTTSSVASCPLFDDKVLSHTLDLHNAAGTVADVTGEDINNDEN